MVLATWKDLCIDAVDPAAAAAFWAGALGLQLDPTDPETLRGPTPQHTVWVCRVPEPKTVKNRVHWDVTGEPDALLEAGATLVRARGEDRRWDVLADPDGNEFCVFVPG